MEYPKRSIYIILATVVIASILLIAIILHSQRLQTNTRVDSDEKTPAVETTTLKMQQPSPVVTPSVSSTTQNNHSSPATVQEATKPNTSDDSLTQKERDYFDAANTITDQILPLYGDIYDILSRKDITVPEAIQLIEPIRHKLIPIIKRGKTIPIPEVFVDSDKKFQEALNIISLLDVLIIMQQNWNSEYQRTDLSYESGQIMDLQTAALEAFELRKFAYRRAQGRE